MTEDDGRKAHEGRQMKENDRRKERR